MKRLLLISALALPLAWTACNTADSRYVDLNTGKAVDLEKDEETGLMVNAETKEPVHIYVDTRTNDTINGRNGEVVNGHLVRNGDSWDVKIKTDDDGDWKMKDGDYKKKVEADGDVKIKNGDTKIKIDGETGEQKVKVDD